MTDPFAAKVFRNFPDDPSLAAVREYIETGTDEAWKKLCRVNFPEYGSKLEGICGELPLREIRPGKGETWDRVFRVLGCFLSGWSTAKWITKLHASYGDSDWFERYIALIPETHLLRFEKAVACYVEKERADGTPNCVGDYFLAKGVSGANL